MPPLLKMNLDMRNPIERVPLKDVKPASGPKEVIINPFIISNINKGNIKT